MYYPILKSNLYRNEVRRKLPTIACLLLFLLFAGGCKHAEKPPAEGEPEAAPAAVEITLATTSSSDTTITAQGTLAPAQGASAKVSSAIPGRLTAVNVREGDHVIKGAVIAVVDNRPQRAMVSSAHAALTTAEAQAKGSELSVRSAINDQKNNVKMSKMQLEAAILDRDNNVKQANNALQTAESDLKRTRAGSRPQEIAQADQAVVQAKATHDRAKLELNRSEKLVRIGVAPKSRLEDAQTAVDLAQSAWEIAKQQASLMRSGSRPEELRSAELRVEGAKELLAQANKTGESKISQARAMLKQAEQSIMQLDVKRQEAAAMRETARQKLADLGAAKATAAYAEVKAPIDGIVTKRNLNPGDSADPTTPIVEITNSLALNLIANLPAEDGGKVHLDQEVRITSADRPGKTFAGRLLSIGQIDPQTNLLTIRIGINANGVLRIGSFATAEIVLEHHPNSVVVPKATVLSRDGKQVVFVVGPDNKAHQKEVVVGSQKEGLTSIEKGLKPGEKVITLGHYELTDGASVHEAESAAKPGEDKKAGKDEKK